MYTKGPTDFSGIKYFEKMHQQIILNEKGKKGFYYLKVSKTLLKPKTVKIKVFQKIIILILLMLFPSLTYHPFPDLPTTKVKQKKNEKKIFENFE